MANITYTCKGPRLDIGAAKMELASRIDALTQIAKTAEHDAVKVSIQERIDALSEQFKALDEPEAQMKRVGCGQDLTPLITALPVDGSVYNLECPKCGNRSSVRRVPVPQVAA